MVGASWMISLRWGVPVAFLFSVVPVGLVEGRRGGGWISLARYVEVLFAVLVLGFSESGVKSFFVVVFVFL